MIEALRKQIGGPRDGALLRFSLGHALLGIGDAAEAVDSLRAALVFDPHYSAAWKLLGQAQLKKNDPAAAIAAWQQGIGVATARGDTQAAKEMAVFLRRAQRTVSHDALPD